MGSHVENNAVLNNNQEVDAALLQSLIDNHGASSDFPFALQSQNHVQNNNQEVDAEQLQFLIDSQEAGFDSPSALQSQNHVQNNNQEVDALQSFIDNHGASFGFPFALQSQNHVQNNNQEAGFDSPSALQSQNLDDLDEEDVIDFADSLLIAPDEYGVEIPPHLLNDYTPPTPRSSSNAYVLDSSDREAYLAYGESPNLYGGHSSSRAYQRKQRAHCDDTLLMGPSSMDSTTVTRHEQINSIQSDFPRIHKAQHAPIPHSFMEQEGISAKGDQFLGGISSTASKHKAREGARQVANIDLPKKVGIESVKDRKIVQVMNAKPAVKSRSNGSAGNEKWGRFIHLETTTSSHTSTPPSAYLFNLVVGLFLFLFMLREVLIVH